MWTLYNHIDVAVTFIIIIVILSLRLGHPAAFLRDPAAPLALGCLPARQNVRMKGMCVCMRNNRNEWACLHDE